MGRQWVGNGEAGHGMALGRLAIRTRVAGEGGTWRSGRKGGAQRSGRQVGQDLRGVGQGGTWNFGMQGGIMAVTVQ